MTHQIQWPERIYLVHDEDCEGLEQTCIDEATWCADKINATDIEYLRADIAHLRQPAPTAQGDLPPLPKPWFVDCFTREQMQAYARTAIAHLRSQQLDVLKLAEADLAEEFEAFGNDLSPSQSLTKVRAAIATAQAAAGVPELRQIVEIDHTSDMLVVLRFTSCRAASSFFNQVKEARWPDAAPSAPAQSDSAGDARDAARWRALLASERIRPLGSAGLNSPEPDNYAHMGLEIWTKYGRGYGPKLLEQMDRENKLGREWLTKYADVAIAASAAKGEQTI